MMAAGRLFCLVGIALTFVMAMATAIPTTPGVLRAPIDGYSIHEMSWELEVDPKNNPGQTTLFNGTIQNAIAQATAINPSFLVDHSLTDADLAKEGRVKSPSDRMLPDRHFCHGKWYPSQRLPIKHGVQYLDTAGGKPGQGPGPASCGRVSCSYGGAIWW